MSNLVEILKNKDYFLKEIDNDLNLLGFKFNHNTIKPLNTLLIGYINLINLYNNDKDILLYENKELTFINLIKIYQIYNQLYQVGSLLPKNKIKFKDLSIYFIRNLIKEKILYLYNFEFDHLNSDESILGYNNLTNYDDYLVLGLGVNGVVIENKENINNVIKITKTTLHPKEIENLNLIINANDNYLHKPIKINQIDFNIYEIHFPKLFNLTQKIILNSEDIQLILTRWELSLKEYNIERVNELIEELQFLLSKKHELIKIVKDLTIYSQKLGMLGIFINDWSVFIKEKEIKLHNIMIKKMKKDYHYVFCDYGSF